MKEQINLSDYAKLIEEQTKKGVLMNTQSDGQFNTMLIGWGNFGNTWYKPTFTAYVRTSRYTYEMLKRSGEFTISIPVEETDPKIAKVCGSLSGRDVDKVREAGLTLEEPRTNGTPGVREYPLTLECKVRHESLIDPATLPTEIAERYYPDPDGDPASAPHVLFLGEVVDAYRIS